jgi:hypothetical protein
MILETDVREAIEKFAIKDLAVTWQALNACRKPGTWKEVDTYPYWETSITDVMPFCHRMEVMLYTFRPLPGLYYSPKMWRPWPWGFGSYTSEEVKVFKRDDDSPLLAHYGYRGPTHFLKKYGKGGRHRKYLNWDMTDEDSVLNTVSFFNGDWNGRSFPMSRGGWKEWVKAKSMSRT